MREARSEQFRALAARWRGKEVPLKEVVQAVGPDAQALLTLFFSLPFLFFVPIPGLSSLFGLLILINGFRIGMRRSFWAPRALMQRAVAGDALAKTLTVLQKVLRALEKIVKPRGHFLHRHPLLARLNGWILVSSGFFLMLPLPPGTNFTPALASFLISLGVLEQDGFVIVLGYCACALNLAFFILLPLWGLRYL
jgi:hypothetical protein